MFLKVLKEDPRTSQDLCGGEGEGGVSMRAKFNHRNFLSKTKQSNPPFENLTPLHTQPQQGD